MAEGSANGIVDVGAGTAVGLGLVLLLAVVFGAAIMILKAPGCPGIGVTLRHLVVLVPLLAANRAGIAAPTRFICQVGPWIVPFSFLLTREGEEPTAAAGDLLGGLADNVLTRLLVASSPASTSSSANWQDAKNY
jgi:hypothetical protein